MSQANSQAELSDIEELVNPTRFLQGEITRGGSIEVLNVNRKLSQSFVGKDVPPQCSPIGDLEMNSQHLFTDPQRQIIKRNTIPRRIL